MPVRHLNTLRAQVAVENLVLMQEVHGTEQPLEDLGASCTPNHLKALRSINLQASYRTYGANKEEVSTCEVTAGAHAYGILSLYTLYLLYIFFYSLLSLVYLEFLDALLSS